MAYDLQWGSANPGHLVYLLDLSGSMAENGKIDTLLEVLKDTCILMITDPENLTRASVSIIGYNSDVSTLFKGTLNDILKIFEKGGGLNAILLDKEKSIQEGGCRPEWQTYTAKAFRWAKNDIEEWIAAQERAGKRMPAPMIIHVTDGYPYEEERKPEVARADALKAAQEIMNISLPDGNPLIFNIHIGDDPSREVLFPTQRLAEEDQQFLYDSSSIMPDNMVSNGISNSLPASHGCHLMASNVRERAKLAQLIAFGSIPRDFAEPPRPR